MNTKSGAGNPEKKKEEFRVSCRVPKAVRTRLKKAAVANGISESDLVRMGINRFLPEFEKGIQLKAKAA